MKSTTSWNSLGCCREEPVDSRLCSVRGGAILFRAIHHGIPHGGWCPKGRKPEDGVIPPQYQLAETPSVSYLQRTEWSVRDSDGTVIFTMAAKLAVGSKRTAEFANKHGKPWLHISYAGGYERPGERLAAFVR